MKLRFTKRAVRQIEEIIDAIALESPQGARRVRDRLSTWDQAVDKIVAALARAAVDAPPGGAGQR